MITTGGGYPLDMTFYQCIKGITAAENMVRPGGRILMMGACEEGVGSPEFRANGAGTGPTHEFLTGIEGVPVTVDQWQLEKLALVTQKSGALCGPRVPAEYQRRVWGRAYPQPQEAVRRLVRRAKAGGASSRRPRRPLRIGEE